MLLINSIILLATAVSAVSLVERTPAAVLAQIQKADADTKNLTAAVNAFNGSVYGIIPIHNAEVALDNDIRAANRTLYTEPVYSCTDSTTTNNYLTSPLEPDTLTMTRAWIAKKSPMYKAGLKGFALNQLQQLRSDYQVFFKLYATKVCAAQKSRESALAAKIDTDFAYAIQQINATTS